MEELSKNQIEVVSGGNSVAGAAMTLGGTLVGIGVAVAAGGIVGVLGIGVAAVGGLAYAFDYYSDHKTQQRSNMTHRGD